MLGLSILASTQLFAFDFGNFGGEYELQDLGVNNQNCPSVINVLRENSKFYVYSLDESKDLFVPAIDLETVDKGEVSNISPGIKSKIDTYVSNKDSSYLIMSEKGKNFYNSNNTIAVPFSKFENYYTFQQGDNTDKLVYVQTGDHQEMTCYYLKN